jgi:ABC-type glycerol-3-phosphate transport system permease component
MFLKSQKSMQLFLTKTSASSVPASHNPTVKRDLRLYLRGRRYQRWSLALTYVVLGIGAFIFLAPFAWLVSASLKNTAQYYADPIQWLPNPVLWSNYVEAFTIYSFAQAVGNSLFLAFFAMIVSTTVSSLIAFGFARFRFPGRTVFFIIMLSTLMLPGQALTIPLYIIYRNLGWVGTFLPILVPQIFGSAYSIFLFRQFFLGLARELDEAARIDGCGNLGIWWNVIIPQSKPVLIAVAIFTFLNSWRDAWNPLIYLNTQGTRTVPLALLYFTNGYTSVYPQMMAATVVALAVPVALYAIGQRYIDSGVAIAEIK